MEAASGINLFGTQNPPATKSLGFMPFISMQSFIFFCFSEEFIACYYG
jgi:hypothetical protein